MLDPRPQPLSATIRRRMKKTLRRDTGPELRLRSLLHHVGLRFRVDAKPLPELRTRADLLFRKARVAIFVDGCFWHSCPCHGTWPKNNSAWWKAKLDANKQRDARANSSLRASGWKVVRIWEHEGAERALSRVLRALVPPIKRGLGGSRTGVA
ncbi:MAG: very short patch repair endonuclease [Archangium sp.]|nr:very short patch repair endonuclease [Archangium sp.]